MSSASATGTQTSSEITSSSPEVSISASVSSSLSSTSSQVIYDVKFDSRGGSTIPPMNVIANRALIAPPVFRAGYQLAAWYTSNDAGLSFLQPWDFQNDRVNAHVTLYARWYLDSKVDQLSSMASHGLALTDHGVLLGWGSNTFNQNGLGEALMAPTILLVTDDDPLVQIVTGSTHSLVLTATSSVYAWGSNSHGQLALPAEVQQTGTPTKIMLPLLEDETVVHLAAGHAHTLAVTSLGRVMTWGFNLYGQIGDGSQTTLGTNRNKYTPTLIHFADLLPLEKVIRVYGSAGHSSYALTNMGTVYAWGRSAYGSLGILPGGHKLTPAKVTFASLQLDEVIDDLVIGGLHVFSRTNLQRWFSFGFNNAGQLGNNSLIQQDLPTLFNPQGLEGTIIERMVAGSNYSVCLTEGGDLYAFGDNRYGHLGIGSTENALLPQRINLPNLNETDQIKTMAAAGLQTYATTEEGRIFAWGSNPYPSTMIGFNDYETSPIDVTMMIIQSLGFF